MAVTNRFIGINFGEINKSGAGQQAITFASATTGKDLEIRVNFGDPAGTAPQIASNAFAKQKALVVAYLHAMLDQIENNTWFNT